MEPWPAGSSRQWLSACDPVPGEDWPSWRPISWSLEGLFSPPLTKQSFLCLRPSKLHPERLFKAGSSNTVLHALHSVYSMIIAKNNLLLNNLPLEFEDYSISQWCVSWLLSEITKKEIKITKYTFKKIPCLDDWFVKMTLHGTFLIVICSRGIRGYGLITFALYKQLKLITVTL